MKIITTILLLFGLNLFGQTVRVNTFRIPKSDQFKGVKTDDLNFPIIKTENSKIDKLINFDLKNNFTDNEFPDSPIDSTLIQWADNQIISLDFEVTYNKNGILSLNISAEGCGAYCTSWTSYYNYSIITGKSLDINDIIETSSSFKNKVIADKNKQYNQQRKILKDMLLDPTFDKEAYEWALKSYDECDKTIELKSFALYPERIEIIESCYLPNAIKYLTPTIELKYKYSSIKKCLKNKKLATTNAKTHG